MCSIAGVGKRLHKVLGQIGSKLWFPWQQKAPIDLQWGKRCLHLFSVVFDTVLFILQIRRTCNFVQIGPLIALEHLKTFPWLITGNAVSMLARSFFIKSSSKLLVARSGIKLRRVWFWAGSDYSVWSYLPLNDKNFTLSNLTISEASWPILIKFYV